uniref:NACHT LRR and PYD domain-containing protein n=1 Tax=Sinocyclocheilus grahami TaxID=75366 RepID=A0A672KQ10_SINGR
MCHNPVFCWISATVLERMMGKAESAEIPKTLTQMFTHFLIFQTKLKTQKYDGKYEIDPDQVRKTILSLGKLAFEQLEKGNLIFYEEDLKECGIDVREVSVYSGVCTQIFREESGLQLGKVYSFVHLSIQEFLAALFKLLSFSEHNTGLLNMFGSPMTSLLKGEVDKALQRENGHWDLFLRFLLGLSLESNQTILQGLLRKTISSSDNNPETAEYIKQKIRENPSPDKSINLFHCLNELNDRSLEQEVQTYLSRTGARCLSGVRLSPAQWSALVFMLLNSEEELDEFKLNKYDSSEECLLRLLPRVARGTYSLRVWCELFIFCCSAIGGSVPQVVVLKVGESATHESSTVNSSLIFLFILCSLSNCHITQEGCAALSSALRSNPSHLTELNLSDNNPGDSGVKLLSALLEDPHCKLKKLQLWGCSIGEEGCVALISALKSNPSHLTELNLNFNKPGDSGVKLLSAVLEDPHYKLEKLQLSSCSFREEGCAVLISALRSNPSHLRELNLNCNKPGDSGVKLLSALLEDPHCKLQKLQLWDCSIGEEGCAALISALRSNPSHLTELNLNCNNPGDSGVKMLSALLEDPHCKLQKLLIGEKGCAALILALRSNPSHLTELNLNCNNPGDSGVKLLSALLEDPHCKLKKLQLWSCSIGEKGCAALILALRSNPSHLTELNLNCNNPGDSGVKLLSALLEDPHCKLKKLQLWDCSIGEEGCAALISALRSNPSHLTELNLSRNKPGDSGVKLLSALLEDPHCKLQKLQ